MMIGRDRRSGRLGALAAGVGALLVTLSVSAQTPAARREVVWRAPHYIVTWGDGDLWVQLLHEGVADGPPFRAFYAGFWAREAGYAVRRQLASATIETAKPPIRAASSEVRLRIRLEDERKSRVEADARFLSNSVVIEARYRMSARESVGIGRASVYFGRPPHVPARPVSTIANLAELCRDLAVDLVLEDGSRITLPFADDVANQIRCTQWTVRGLWTNWVVRGTTDRRDAWFRYWQYSGTKPVEGFGFLYLREGANAEGRATIEWLPAVSSSVGVAPSSRQ